jgi:sterol desaturase/sphingolipid hydroxylase (fatty acid hydroxylase superfamily)
MTTLEIKQQQFNAAMELYEKSATYKRIDASVAIMNITLQFILLYQALTLPLNLWWQLVSLVTAYCLTDFLNGLIHVYMDNNDNYTSFTGPLVAKFHLHHKIPRYKDNNLFTVYFNETGSKVWLVFYLAALVTLSSFSVVNSVFLCILIYIGILSSVAEVSHYLCHNSTAPTALFLMRIGVLLSKRHHARHHLEDNANYAFLNGMTDPLINFIADRLHLGYKKSTDLHYALYTGESAPLR